MDHVRIVPVRIIRIRVDEITLHGGVQFVVTADAADETADADAVAHGVVAHGILHAIATPRSASHAVGLHRDRDDTHVLLRIVTVDFVADDRVEAREGLVEERLFHGCYFLDGVGGSSSSSCSTVMSSIVKIGAASI